MVTDGVGSTIRGGAGLLEHLTMDEDCSLQGQAEHKKGETVDPWHSYAQAHTWHGYERFFRHTWDGKDQSLQNVEQYFFGHTFSPIREYLFLKARGGALWFMSNPT